MHVCPHLAKLGILETSNFLHLIFAIGNFSTSMSGLVELIVVSQLAFKWMSLLLSLLEACTGRE